MNVPVRGVYAITDCQDLDSVQLFHITERILHAGIAMLQYRDKATDPELRIYRANQLHKLCAACQVPFIINDDLELAQNIGADGVHLGRDDVSLASARKVLGSAAIIGVSCYNRLPDALLARDQGADYVAFGSFFPSRTKPGAVRALPELLVRAKDVLDIPLVAIGGITQENGGILVRSGADLLAIITGIYGEDNPEQAARNFNQIFDTYRENHHS